MLFLKGLLSLVQVAFLPGFLLLIILKLSRGVIKTLVLSFALSLIINHYLVYLLTVLHVYNSTVMYCILALEALAVVYLLFHYASDSKYPAIQTKNLLGFINELSPFRLFILLLALTPLFFFIIHYFESGRNTVFVVSDAILRWDAWATTWFHGHISFSDSNYPQLMPINWSITYVFLQTNFIQLFAKIINFLAPIAIILTLFDLAFRKRDFSYIWAIIALSVLWYVLLGAISYQGYADMLCSFMALTTIYLLFLTEVETHNAKKYIILSIVTCAGAAVTKQAGIYLVCIYPIFFYFQQRSRFSNKEKLNWILLSIGLLAILVVPFYVASHLPPMMQKFSLKNIMLSSLSYYQLSYLQRIQFGILVLLRGVNVYFLYTLFPLFIIAALFISVQARKVFFIVVMPYVLIWLVFYSYDVRNLTFILPVLALSLGFGMCGLVKALSKEKRFSQFGKTLLFLLLILSVLMLFMFKSPARNILQSQYYAKAKYIGDVNFNKLLYGYFGSKNVKRDYLILTNAPFLQFLPHFENKVVYNTFQNSSSFLRYLQKDKNTYIILNKYLMLDVINHLKYGFQKQTLRSVWFDIYGVIDGNLLKKKNVDKVIIDRVLNNKRIRKYKIIYNTPDLLFIKIENKPNN